MADVDSIDVGIRGDGSMKCGGHVSCGKDVAGAYDDVAIYRAL